MDNQQVIISKPPKKADYLNPISIGNQKNQKNISRKLPPGASPRPGVLPLTSTQPPGASPRPGVLPLTSRLSNNKIGKYMSVVSEFPLIHDLLSIVLDECERKDSKLTKEIFFTYKYKIPDPFLEYEPAGVTLDNPNLSNLHELYMSINPSYKPISELPIDKLQFPFYKYVVAQMAKDLVVLVVESKFPKTSNKTLKQLKKLSKIQFIKSSFNNNVIKSSFNNNDILNVNVNSIPNNRTAQFTNYKLTYRLRNQDTNIIKELLNLIEECIAKNYLYYDKTFANLLSLIFYYQLLFTYGLKEGFKQIFKENIRPEFQKRNQYEKLFYRSYEDLGNKIYIIYPSFKLINYFKILHFITTPIINLYLTNSISITHNIPFAPLNQSYHDIVFHGFTMHYSKNLSIPIFYNIKLQIFKLIYPYINYKINYKLNNVGKNIEEDMKYISCVVYFMLLHESEFTIDISSPLVRYPSVEYIIRLLESKKEQAINFSENIDPLFDKLISKYFAAEYPKYTDIPIIKIGPLLNISLQQIKAIHGY